MGREKYAIEKMISLDKLDWFIRVEKNTEILPKLFFIRLRYLGHSVEKATNELGFAKSIGYEWQNRWNEKGYEGLLHNPGAGRPSKLNDEQKEELKTILKSKAFWTTEEVRDLIQDKYDIGYSLNSIRGLLRKFKMNYTTPYCFDHRRPADAEEVLKKI